MGKFFKTAETRASMSFGIAREALRKARSMGLRIERGGEVAKFTRGTLHVPKASRAVYKMEPSLSPRSVLLHELGHGVDFQSGKSSRKRLRLALATGHNLQYSAGLTNKRIWGPAIYNEYRANQAAQKFIGQHSKRPVEDLRVFKERAVPAFNAYRGAFQHALASKQDLLDVAEGVNFGAAAAMKGADLDRAAWKSIMRKKSPKHRKRTAQNYLKHKEILHWDYVGKRLK